MACCSIICVALDVRPSQSLQKTTLTQLPPSSLFATALLGRSRVPHVRPRCRRYGQRERADTSSYLGQLLLATA